MRTCLAPGCGKPLTQNQGEQPYFFKKRKTCNKTCGYKLTTLASVTRIATKDPCPICGELLVRHAGEPLCAFAKRRTCGGACGHALRGVLQTTTKIFERHCPACGEILARHNNEPRPNFMLRKTCGDKCGRKLITKHHAIPDRDCPACGEVLVRRSDETWRKFALRKTCGEKCGHKLKLTAIVEGRLCVVCDEVLKQRAKEARPTFMKRTLCSKECARKHVRLIDFYGSQLPISAVAEILGKSKKAVYAFYAKSKEAREGREEDPVSGTKLSENDRATAGQAGREVPQPFLHEESARRKRRGTKTAPLAQDLPAASGRQSADNGRVLEDVRAHR